MAKTEPPNIAQNERKPTFSHGRLDAFLPNSLAFFGALPLVLFGISGCTLFHAFQFNSCAFGRCLLPLPFVQKIIEF
jgi:hypothetical protein